MERCLVVFISALAIYLLACGPERLPVGFPVHREPLVVNLGSDYVYGDLHAFGGCLYVTYADSGSFGVSPAGVLVIWPAGYRVSVDGSEGEVFDGDGVSVASVGDTLRVSGRLLRDLEGVDWNWDPVGSSDPACAGPYWLVGDEVARDVGDDDGASGAVVSLPRLLHQRGPVVKPQAAVVGNLVLRDGCLHVLDRLGSAGYVVVWPPGYRAGSADGVVVLNGGGNVVARVGEQVRLVGGGYMGGGLLAGSSCSGPAFKAYEVYGVVGE